MSHKEIKLNSHSLNPQQSSSYKPYNRPSKPYNRSSKPYNRSPKYENKLPESREISLPASLPVENKLSYDSDGSNNSSSSAPRYKPYCKKTGPCVGCGDTNAHYRQVTKEYLCETCRKNPEYKLITKTTALGTYTVLTDRDLYLAHQNKIIRCYFVKNWYNPSAQHIKLFYEKEIKLLAQNQQQNQNQNQTYTVRQSIRQHTRQHTPQSSSHSKPKKYSSSKSYSQKNYYNKSNYQSTHQQAHQPTYKHNNFKLSTNHRTPPLSPIKKIKIIKE